MNAVIINDKKRISVVLSQEEAGERLSRILWMYPSAYIELVDEEIKKPVDLNIKPEEVEDLSCAGGACTL